MKAWSNGPARKARWPSDQNAEELGHEWASFHVPIQSIGSGYLKCYIEKTLDFEMESSSAGKSSVID